MKQNVPIHFLSALGRCPGFANCRRMVREVSQGMIGTCIVAVQFDRISASLYLDIRYGWYSQIRSWSTTYYIDSLYLLQLMVTGESAPCIVRERIKQCLMCLLMCVYNNVRPTPNVNPLSTTSQKRAGRCLNVIWNRQQRCALLPATLFCVQIAISISKYE